MVSSPEGIEAQADASWRNIISILEDAGMSIDDLVKITTYLASSDCVVAAGAARAQYLADARPASATLIIGGFVKTRVVSRDRSGCGQNHVAKLNLGKDSLYCRRSTTNQKVCSVR